MGFVDQFLEENGGELVGGLVQQLGFSKEQAQTFVPIAVSKVLELLQGGGLDLGSLLGGASAKGVSDRIDVGQLASQAGVSEPLAQQGVESLVPTLLSKLGEQGGGAEGVGALLGGGDASKLLGGVGKLFGN